MKTLFLGNEAVARGLYEAGCGFVSSYPGTPSTEITECAAKYSEIYAEWAPNEKVALEAALGACLGGKRAFCGMKHVGLNVAADPLFIGAYTGVGAGLVIGVADDPGMHSSQNEQDSRHYAESAKLPMLEPSDSAECKEFTKLAFELSEAFDTPVLLRLTTRVSHARSLVECADRQEPAAFTYEKDPQKHVMMPAYAKPRHLAAEDRLRRLSAYAETSDLNRIEFHQDALGIVCAGNTYNYAKEVFGDRASYLKLGMVHPFPEQLARQFAGKVKRLIVIEELDPFLENKFRALGIACEGKNLLSLCGEYSQDLLKERLENGSNPHHVYPDPIPPRPPVLCPGCPHRGLYYVLKKLNLRVFGDIGCYTLGAVAPLNAIDTCFCMGASVSAMHGFEKASPEAAKNSVGVIGDSTFMHSGITGLVNLCYNQANATLIILDNSITAMTGHQQNPCTGYTLKGEAVHGILPEKICEGAGVDPKHIRITDPNEPEKLEAILREELAFNGVSVIITRRPCVLLKQVKKDKLCTIESDSCKNCRACMKLGCPAIYLGGGKRPQIDGTLCTGCTLCTKLCKFGAIRTQAR